MIGHRRRTLLPLAVALVAAACSGSGSSGEVAAPIPTVATTASDTEGEPDSDDQPSTSDDTGERQPDPDTDADTEEPSTGGDEPSPSLIGLGEPRPSGVRFETFTSGLDDTTVEIPPGGADGVVELGIEQDVWSEVDGTLAALRWLVGDTEPGATPSFGETRTGSAGDVVERAQALVAADPGSAAAAELTALLDRLFPFDVLDATLTAEQLEIRTITDETIAATPTGPVQLDRLAQGLRRPQSVGGSGLLGQTDRCATARNTATAAWESAVPDLAECWRRVDFEGPDWDLLVYAPASPDFEQVLSEIESIAIRTMAAVPRTSRVIAQLVLSPVDADDAILALREDGDVLGLAVPTDLACQVVVFRDGDGMTQNLANTISHELVHCIQFEEWSGANDLATEGGATAVAHRLYPTAQDTTLADDFAQLSLERELFDFDYAGWLWWWFLDEAIGRDASWEAQRSQADGAMVLPGDSEQLWNDFVAAVVLRRLTSAGGERLPTTLEASTLDRVTTADVARFESFSVTPWIASRWQLTYDAGIEVTHDAPVVPATATFSTAVVNHPSQIVLCDPVLALLIPTTTTDTGEVEVSWGVRELDTDEGCEPEGDECLVGSWVMDMRQWDQLFEDLAGSTPQGFSFTVTGTYNIVIEADFTATWWTFDNEFLLASESVGFEEVISNRNYNEGVIQPDGIDTLAIDATLELSDTSMDNPLGEIAVENDGDGQFDASVGGTETGSVSAGPLTSGRLGYDCAGDRLELVIPETSTVFVLDRVDALDVPDGLPS